MFRPIKYKHSSAHALCREQIWFLGTIPRAVDLSIMQDTLYDLDARGGGGSGCMELARVFVVVVSGERVWIAVSCGSEAFGHVDRGDLEVVFLLAGGMSTDEETIYGV